MTLSAQQRSAVIRAAKSDGLAQFSRPGTKIRQSLATTSRLHQFNSVGRLRSPQQDDAVNGQNIQQPVHPIIDVCIDGAGRMTMKKLFCRRPSGNVTGGIVFRRVRFRFDDNSGGAVPDKSTSQKIASDLDVVAVEERTTAAAIGTHTKIRRRK